MDMFHKNQKPQSTKLNPTTVIRNKRMKAESAEEIRKFLGKILLVAIILYLAIQVVWGFSIVEGNHMAPALRDGDLTLIYRLDKNYQKTESVVYYNNLMKYCGRIVGVGGDTIDMDSKGQLLVNGKVAQEEIFYPTRKKSKSISYPYKVKENEYFILGDYRTEATDSRTFGSVPAVDIQGKVIGSFRRRGI